MELPKVSKAAASAMEAERGAALRKLLVQGVFLFTGVLSTCVAQFVFYQGAGEQKAMLLPLCNYLGMMLVGLLPTVGAAAVKKTVEKIQDKEKKLEKPLIPRNRSACPPKTMWSSQSSHPIRQTR
ncbi:hypothetical protein P3T76_005880 [Phytophthora citrophthora]|uniref:Uncharacterized protein n=1 Tax=Phytophthora citrophthora TaxID=4793 RepID=A0AAD9LNG3_9STRA|nr:hypothetical protein P3T76_005880 [Phytophthora citrophthora]